MSPLRLNQVLYKGESKVDILADGGLQRDSFERKAIKQQALIKAMETKDLISGHHER